MILRQVQEFPLILHKRGKGTDGTSPLNGAVSGYRTARLAQFATDVLYIALNVPDLFAREAGPDIRSPTKKIRRVPLWCAATDDFIQRSDGHALGVPHARRV